MKRFILIFMLCFIGLCNPLKAQETVTIGSGTQTSSMVPVDLWNYYGQSQQLFFSDEIGMDAGTITGISLKFYDVTNGPLSIEPVDGVPQPTRSFAIYMQNTDLTNMNDGYQVVNYAPSYSGTVTLVENGWTQFDFDTPFEYTGGNILVTIIDNSGYSAGDYYYHWFVFDNGGGNALCVSAIPSEYPNPAEPLYNPNTYTMRNQIQLHLGAAGGNEPVYDVLATQIIDKNNVDVVWSWNEIVPQTLVVNFETGDFSQADFVNDMTYPWVITEDAYEGTYAIKSTNQGQHSSNSSIEVTVDVPNDGYMSFYHKISCEYYFDNGYFYIDDVERSLVTDNVDWEYKEFPVKKGQHTYRWSFVKDESDYFPTGEDTYYVDNITLYAPEEEFAGGWIYYDDGNYKQAMSSDAESGLTQWGISFPETAEYAGYSLTKLAYYPKNTGAVTVNIYLGGTDAPGELVANKMFTISTKEQMVELELSEPIVLDGTQPLWITFASYDWYMATACNYVDDPNSDWFVVGNEWKHIVEVGQEMGMDLNFSWMIRGYLENSRGEVAVLSNDRGAADVTGYNLYRLNTLTEEEELIASNVTDTTYTDNSWATADYGIYKWGVSALYGTAESEKTWSNELHKDMYATVGVKVTTNSGDSPEGAQVRLINISEPNMGYDYRTKLDESGEYQWDNFRKGTYEYTVYLEGYESCAFKDEVTITEATTLECVLEEIAGAVDNLYVSSTGYATWQIHDFDNGGGEFSFNFDDGSVEGWRMVDADGDGFEWCISDSVMSPWQGYNGSKYHIVSLSYYAYLGGLTPDNYLITTDKYLITETSQLSYFVSANSKDKPLEHYSVLVSTVGDDNFENYEVIWEETMHRNTNATRKGNWYERNLDLSKFAGQEVYIAFRHFDTYSQSCINVDDITLVNNARPSRAVESYTIKLNGEVVAENVKENYYQHENIEAGATYTTAVIANYTTSTSAAVEYTWTAASCEDYEGVAEITGREFKGRALIEWRMEGDEEPQEAQSSFYSSFNDGKLSGWVTIDADGDGYNWCSSESLLGENGFNGYKDGMLCAMSQSFDGIDKRPLHPDNYMVTPEKYLITENSQLTFVVCAQSPEYPEEHYGVAVSMLSNTNPADFTTIWEETIEKDDPDLENPQTDWKFKTVDLSEYAGEEIYIAFRHFNCTDEYMICLDDVELTSGERNAKRSSELIGFKVYCDGELIADLDPSLRGINVDFPGGDEYEYCVRAVYSDYGMSCPECVTIDAPIICVAPEDLHAEESFNAEGESGVQLTWPYQAPPMSEWLYYDDNVPVTAIGLGGTMYWSIMFPAESLSEYIKTSVTKVKVYDTGNETGEATILVSYGSLVSPGEALATKNISFDGTAGWKEVELPQAVEITGEDNVWITVFQHGMNYPAAVSTDCGNPNARWISANGMQWQDLGSFGSQYEEMAFMIRAFVTNEADRNVNATRELVTFEAPEVNTDEVNVSMLEEPVFAPRATEFSHYNVYRGTSEDNFELIATTTEGSYFDTDVEAGKYYYKVTATYVDGEEYCESKPANSFYQPGKDYVVVDYTSIKENDVNGMMIYPNPTRDNVIVKADNMKRITIVNTMGQVMYDQAVMSDSEEINMSQFESGVYMIRITTDNGVATQRVMVVK